MYDLAIFDLDGTLLNTVGDLRDALNYSLKKNGFAEKNEREVATYLGNGLTRLIAQAIPLGENDPKFKVALEDFKKYYIEHMDVLTVEYEGISDLLAELKARGIKTAIVSNKADIAVKKLAEEYFGGLISFALGETETIRRKPAPDMVYAALNGAKSPVYIGDSEVDIVTAKNASLPCISVDWGFRSRETLLHYGATNIVSSVGELKRLLIEK